MLCKSLAQHLELHLMNFTAAMFCSSRDWLFYGQTIQMTQFQGMECWLVLVKKTEIGCDKLLPESPPIH